MNARLLNLVPLALGLAVVLVPGSSVYTADSYIDDSGIFSQSGMVRNGDALPEDDGIQTLAKGPVHEAFAEPVSGEVKPGPVVKDKPPEVINESPAKEKPEAEGVQWILGYWSYDDDRDDYIWVSGIWRAPPPGRKWVPGSWGEVKDGWQWSPGFWMPVKEEKAEVLPPPPAPLTEDEGTPPDDNHTWVPGSWVYQESKYEWRPGFYIQYQPDWVYVPAHYVPTDDGYIFIEGYWDYILKDRGLLFAPAIITREVLAKPDFVYEPTYVVHDQCLLGSLFVRPGHGYYFGDWFDRKYQTRGIVSCVDYRLNGRYNDPLFGYYRQHYRQDKSWERDLRNLYSVRRKDPAQRPPVTLKDQNKFLTGLRGLQQVDNKQVRNNVFLAPVKKVDPKVVKVQTLDRDRLASERKNVQQFREVVKQREQIHTQVVKNAPKKIGDRPAELKLNLPKTNAGTTPVKGKLPDFPKLPKPGEKPAKPIIASGKPNGQPPVTSNKPNPNPVGNNNPNPGGEKRNVPGQVVNGNKNGQPNVPNPNGNKNGPVGQNNNQKNGNSTNNRGGPGPDLNRNGPPQQRNNNQQQGGIRSNNQNQNPNNRPGQIGQNGNRNNGQNTPPVNRNGQNNPQANNNNRNGQTPPVNRNGQNPQANNNRTGQTPPVNRNGQNPQANGNRNGQQAPPVIRNGQNPQANNRNGQNPPVVRNGQTPPVNRNGQGLPNRNGQNPPVVRNGQTPPVNRNIPNVQGNNRNIPNVQGNNRNGQQPPVVRNQQTPPAVRNNIPQQRQVPQNPTPRATPRSLPQTQVPRSSPRTLPQNQAPRATTLPPQQRSTPRTLPSNPTPRQTIRPQTPSVRPSTPSVRPNNNNNGRRR